MSQILTFPSSLRAKADDGDNEVKEKASPGKRKAPESSSPPRRSQRQIAKAKAAPSKADGESTEEEDEEDDPGVNKLEGEQTVTI